MKTKLKVHENRNERATKTDCEWQYAMLELKQHFLLLSILITVVQLNIFVETVLVFFSILSWIERSKELNNSLNFFLKKNTDPKLLNNRVFIIYFLSEKQ